MHCLFPPHAPPQAPHVCLYSQCPECKISSPPPLNSTQLTCFGLITTTTTTTTARCDFPLSTQPARREGGEITQHPCDYCECVRLCVGRVHCDNSRPNRHSKRESRGPRSKFNVTRQGFLPLAIMHFSHPTKDPHLRNESAKNNLVFLCFQLPTTITTCTR